MSYHEAIKDNIPMGKKGTTAVYYPPCHICGEGVESFSYVQGVKYTCKQCKINLLLADKEKAVETSQNVKEKKFLNAVDRIKKNYTRLPKRYSKAFDIVHSKLHKRGWFDSTEEIIVAIELVSRNIKARHQVKFGAYKADFVLPDLKCVLEIDGHIFHTESTKEKENLRDNLIILHLGAEWEVVRISDIFINQNIKNLEKAILTVIETRKKLRAKNNGILPKWYSDRNI
jgi:very-short-patch-repair endonuclease